MGVGVNSNANQRIVTSTNPHVAQPLNQPYITIRKSTDIDGNDESSCGRDIGMMGMWVWVDFNAKQPIINHTQINEP